MWKKLISEILQSEDYTIERIAEDVGVTGSCIHRIIDGRTKQPSYRIGTRLLVLHMRVRRDCYGQLPAPPLPANCHERSRFRAKRDAS